MLGRRLSRPRHCSKGAQPMPKAVNRSGFYEKPATANGGIRPSVLLHRSQACYRLQPVHLLRLLSMRATRKAIGCSLKRWISFAP